MKIADRHAEEWAWRDARARYVTASDACHLMNMTGIGWGKHPDELAQSKLIPSSLPQQTANQARGSLYEASVIEDASLSIGRKICHVTALYGSEQYPWMACSPDAVVTQERISSLRPLAESLWLSMDHEVLHGGEAFEALQGRLDSLPAKEVCGHQGELALLEVKTVPSRSRSRWNKAGKPPDEYWAQVQHQMVVMGFDLALLVAKVDAFELYIHVVEYDELFASMLIKETHEFYNTYLKDKHVVP